MRIMKQLLMVLIGYAGCTSFDETQASIHDVAHTILFSEKAQRLADICLVPTATTDEQTMMFAASCIPLLAFCADIAKSRWTDRGINFNFSGKALGINCALTFAAVGRFHYLRHALDLLKQKISDKKPLSTYEIEKTIALSRRVLRSHNLCHIEHGFFGASIFEHPQLGNNPALIKVLATQCLRIRHTNNHAKTLISRQTTLELIEQHPDLVQSYVKRCLHHAHEADGSLFTDLIFTRYIACFMQADEQEKMANLLITTELPEATEALLKLYKPGVEFACTKVASIINKLPAYFNATPMLDYLGALFMQHTTDTNQQRRLLAYIIERGRINKFPCTLAACNNSAHTATLQELLRQCALNIKEMGDIDVLISALPALAPQIKEHCLMHCPSMQYTKTVKNKPFFVDILLHHFKKSSPRHINAEQAALLDCPMLETLTKQQLNALVPNNNTQLQGPTKKYIDTYPELVLAKFSESIQDKNLQQLSNDLIALEDQEAKRGHYTFVHGEPKQMHALQYWFTKLYEIKYNVTLNDYLFTRFWLHTDKLTQAFQWGKRVICTTMGSRQDVFMGHCLYSNWGGECSGDYYVHSRAIRTYQKSIKSIFEQFGHRALYDIYKKELKALDDEYRNICPHGQLLLFSFSENALRKSVYTSQPGSGKRSVTIVDKVHNTSTTTTDIVTIARAMRDNLTSVEGYDYLLFCFTPTTDYAMHPDIAGKEVRVFNLTGANPERMKAYQAKEQALFERIQADIKAQATQTSLGKDKNSNTITTAQA